MRFILSACVALFLCLPAKAQTCTTPETILQMWSGQIPGLQVVTFKGEQAEKITAAYNKIEPVSNHLADSFYAAASQAVEGVGMIFAYRGCVVATDSGPMEAFQQLLTIALGRGA